MSQSERGGTESSSHTLDISENPQQLLLVLKVESPLHMVTTAASFQIKRWFFVMCSLRGRMGERIIVGGDTICRSTRT